MDDRLLRELTAAETDEQRAAIIAEAGIATLSPASQVVARRCIILHWFDVDIVAALCPEGADAAAVYDELSALPFIEQVPWGVSYHQLTRVGLLARYTANDPTELVTGARLAAPVYAAREAELAQGEALFCLIVAGDSRAASQAFESEIRKAVEQKTLDGLSTIFTLQDEAEAMPFVQSLPRQPAHWVARGIVYESKEQIGKALAAYDAALTQNPRFWLVYVLRGRARQKAGDSIGALKDIDHWLAHKPKDAAEWETSLTHLLLARLRLDQVETNLATLITHTSAEISESLHGASVIVAGMVADVRKLTTRKGESMAFVILEDARGAVDVTVFPQLFNKTSSLWMNGNIVVVRGKVDFRGGRVAVVADEAQEYEKGMKTIQTTQYRDSELHPIPPPWKSTTGAVSFLDTTPHTLRLQFRRSGSLEADRLKLAKLVDLLERYEGHDSFEIIIEAPAGQRYQLAFPDNHTRICSELYDEVRKQFGTDVKSYVTR